MENLSTMIDLVTVGEVSAVWQGHAHEFLAGLQYSHVGGEVSL